MTHANSSASDLQGEFPQGSRSANAGPEHSSLGAPTATPSVEDLTQRVLAQKKLENDFWVALFSGNPDRLTALLTPELARLQDQRQSTPLMLAAINHHVECLKLLLPHSDVDAQNNDGNTALMMAFHGQCLEAARILIPLSNLDLVDLEGRDALFMATQTLHAHDLPPEVFAPFFPRANPERLNGIGIDSGRRRGQTAIDAAIAHRAWPLADFFAQHASDATAQALLDKHGAEKLPGLLARREAALLRAEIAPRAAENGIESSEAKADARVDVSNRSRAPTRL